MPATKFAAIFGDEHRAVRDSIFELIDAFREHDQEAAGALVGRIATLTGPHFRYEEETLYPSLVQIFGADYVSALIDDHDGAIASARRLVELVSAPIGESEAAEGEAAARSLLPHVSDCDGLSIMVELLSDAEVNAVFDTRDRSLEAGLNLLEWADQIRYRPTLAAAS